MNTLKPSAKNAWLLLAWTLLWTFSGPLSRNLAWSIPGAPIQAPTSLTSSKLKSADEGIAVTYYTHPLEMPTPRALTGQDLNAVEAGEVTKHIAAGGDNSKKTLILVRYEAGDMRVADALVAAKNAGYAKVYFVTDSNVIMNGKFDGAPFNSDFDGATYQDNENAKFVKRLLAEGFKFNDPKYGIYLQPLYDRRNDQMAPIMHEKELFLATEKNDGALDIVFINGTNNMSRAPRINRAINVADQDLARFAYDHALALADLFKNKLPIDKLKAKPPLRVTYADNTYAELAFTDGQYNMNDRMASMFDDAAANPNERKVKGVWFSENVLTNGKIVNSLKNLMQAQSDFGVTGVFDGWNAGVYGYELSASMAGYPVIRPAPNAPAALGWRPRLTSRTRLFVYQRGREEKPETTLTGVPFGRHLLHDKTAMVAISEGGRDWLYVFTGSFNASNHFQNAELQMLYKLPLDSPMAKAFLASVENLITTEKDYVIPYDLAMTRQFVGRMLGHSELELPFETTKTIFEHFKNGRYDDAAEVMREFSKTPTSLSEKTDFAAIETRVSRLTTFLKSRFQRGVQPQTLLMAGFGLMNPKATPSKVREAMREVVFDGRVPKSEVEKLTDQAMKDAGYTITEKEPVDLKGTTPKEPCEAKLLGRL